MNSLDRLSDRLAGGLSRPEIRHALGLGGGLLVIAAYLRYLASNLADPDLWGYLAFGRLFWEGPGFPYEDVFSYMPTLSPWIYHEWLTGVVLYPLRAALGEAGMQGLLFAGAFGALFIAWRAARARGASGFACWLACMAAPFNLGYGYSPVRAQLFTFLFFAFSLWLMDSAARSGRHARLAWLAPLMVLWANLHGGFVAGLFIIGAYGAGELLSGRRYWPFVWAGAAAGLAVLINPYGFSYLTYIWDAVTMPRPQIEEWWSIARALELDRSVGNVLAFLALAGVSLTALALDRFRDRTAALVLLATGLMGALHLRHIVFFGLAFVALAPALLDRAWERARPFFSRALRLGVPALAGLVVLIQLIWLPGFVNAFLIRGSLFRLVPMTHEQVRGWPIYYPVGATRFLREQGLRGNLLPQFSWGEYLIWKLYPDCLVGMDGRYETVYPTEVHEAYFRFLHGEEGWREFLAAYPHELILVKPDFGVAPLLREEPGWELLYEDSGGVLFRRVGAGP